VVESERRSIRVWLRQTMKDKGMTANEWATKAGTSPTNITRFLNSDTKYIPSSRTISKLSKVVGTQPGYFQSAQGDTIPVKDASGAVVDMIVDPKIGKVEAYQLGSWTGYGAGGIRSYSTVIIATDQKIKDGDVVAVEDEEHGILCGQAMGKFIVFKASDWEFSKPPLEIKNTKMIGKIVQSITKYNQEKQD
jgi:transcriptional regulator with XRE-family HTH domain